MPAPTRMSSGVVMHRITAMRISFGPIFLPRYSGVRPTMSPAMNTVRMTKPSMPYKPQPTPPNTTSPNAINTMGTMPPIGVKLSCMALTEPFEAAVVNAAHSDESVTPKRVSLPSMLPPDCPLAPMYTCPSAASWGVPICSNTAMATSAPTSKMNMAANTARPWRRSMTKRPKLNTHATGMSSSDRHCTRLVRGVGFSSALAEFTPL